MHEGAQVKPGLAMAFLIKLIDIYRRLLAQYTDETLLNAVKYLNGGNVLNKAARL